MPTPTRHAASAEKEEPVGYNYEDDPRWRSKPLTPAQILVNDIRLEQWRLDSGPMLEVDERFASTLVPETAATTPSASYVRASNAANNPIERQQFSRLEEEYGWMRYLRLPYYQQYVSDSEDSAKCRWIHCSSKFPEYLRGFLWALSNDITTISSCLHALDHVVQQQTRFSKHGKCFAPFFQSLLPGQSEDQGLSYPMIMAVPFLDWGILGTTPSLRFQVDRREGFHSTRSASHLLRSVLQHYYRLEDTAEREASQVFAKHKPWSTNRELDLKCRQWYGHYPSALNVDELWILAIDAEHIVTFSSNQTWKSRWPPLQLTSRISDIAFRGIRNAFFASQQEPEYDSMMHAVVCLSGAVGMLHRNFWPDLVLPLTDRYAGYLGHLQYRLIRTPSTKLVMDLIACQEESNIVIQITQQQLDMIAKLQALLNAQTRPGDTAPSPSSRRRPSISTHTYGDFTEPQAPQAHQRSTYRQLGTSTLADPLAQVHDNLSRELTDLRDLRDNAERLVARTIQLVNIRLEDHGKAILVFTVVTIIFLPLNFVSSFFGMNVSDIRDMVQGQWLFWTVALCVTAVVAGLSVFLAFEGMNLAEKFVLWKDRRKERRLTDRTAREQQRARGKIMEKGLRVVGVEKLDGTIPY